MSQVSLGKDGVRFENEMIIEMIMQMISYELVNMIGQLSVCQVLYI